ncbi:DUF2304 domain-containing protein [Streptococcus marmotae]|uniref:DUF2304 domain-containing protein n=1 Tax=Streptococcus marmotae TaxID=1825069 RepID=UPI00082C5FB5|nr:DUF2304 domain-containing protein [Streptococcus marmotae]
MIKIWVTLLDVLFLFYLVRMVVKKDIEMKNAFSWILLSLLSLPLVWFPPILEVSSNLLGVEVPSNLIFFISIFFLICLVFSLTCIISKQSIQIRKLAQKMALENKNEK